MYVFVFSVCRRRRLLPPSNPAIVISFHNILHEQCWKFLLLIANINGTQGQLWVRFPSFPAGRIKTGHNHCFIAFPNYVFQVSVVVVWSVKPYSVPCFYREGIRNQNCHELKHFKCLQESQSILSNTANHFIQYQLNNVFSTQQAIEGWQERKMNT